MHLHLLKVVRGGQGFGPCQILLKPRDSHTIKYKSHVAYETRMEDFSSPEEA